MFYIIVKRLDIDHRFTLFPSLGVVNKCVVCNQYYYVVKLLNYLIVFFAPLAISCMGDILDQQHKFTV